MRLTLDIDLICSQPDSWHQIEEGLKLFAKRGEAQNTLGTIWIKRTGSKQHVVLPSFDWIAIPDSEWEVRAHPGWDFGDIELRPSTGSEL